MSVPSTTSNREQLQTDGEQSVQVWLVDSSKGERVPKLD
jgi:hypothetical protein